MELIEAGKEMRERALRRHRSRKKKCHSDKIVDDDTPGRAQSEPVYGDGICSSELDLIEKSESRQIEQLDLERSRVRLQETVVHMERTKMDHLERTFLWKNASGFRQKKK